MDKDEATNIGKIKINSIEMYAPQYTASIPQQPISSEKILIELPTEIQYVGRPLFVKGVNNQKFELETQEGINLLAWNIIEFQQKDWEDSQNLNIDKFYRLQ